MPSNDKQTQLLADSGTCSAAWSESTAYLAGNVVSHEGNNFTANWWTQGNNPSTNNGEIGSGQPWTISESCGDTETGENTEGIGESTEGTGESTEGTGASTEGTVESTEGVTGIEMCNTAWSSAAAYETGNKVSVGEKNYTANWWTQGNNPETNNGGTGSGQPWSTGEICEAANPSTGTDPLIALPAYKPRTKK